MWVTTIWVLLVSVCSGTECTPHYQAGFNSLHYCKEAAAPLKSILESHGKRGVGITVTTQCIQAKAPREA